MSKSLSNCSFNLTLFSFFLDEEDYRPDLPADFGKMDIQKINEGCSYPIYSYSTL